MAVDIKLKRANKVYHEEVSAAGTVNVSSSPTPIPAVGLSLSLSEGHADGGLNQR